MPHMLLFLCKNSVKFENKLAFKKENLHFTRERRRVEFQNRAAVRHMHGPELVLPLAPEGVLGLQHGHFSHSSNR
jgi:hypothetical protein